MVARKKPGGGGYFSIRINRDAHLFWVVFGMKTPRLGCTVLTKEKFLDWGLVFAKNSRMSRFGIINNFRNVL